MLVGGWWRTSTKVFSGHTSFLYREERSHTYHVVIPLHIEPRSRQVSPDRIQSESTSEMKLERIVTVHDGLIYQVYFMSSSLCLSSLLSAYRNLHSVLAFQACGKDSSSRHRRRHRTLYVKQPLPAPPGTSKARISFLSHFRSSP